MYYRLEVDGRKNSFELGVGGVDGAVVENVVVSSGDGAAFFDVFDFAAVAVADFGGGEGTLGAMSETFIAEGFGGDDGDDGDLTWEFMLEGFVFGPRIDTVEDDTLLAGSDKIFGFGDGLADNPIFALGGADHFTKFTLSGGSDFDAALFHFAIKQAAEVDFRDAVLGKIVDDDGFASAAHANDGENFDVFHVLIITLFGRTGRHRLRELCGGEGEVV